jgi:hypothetical protein
MPKGEMFPAAPISEIFSLRSLLGMEWMVKEGWWCMRTMQGHIQ